MATIVVIGVVMDVVDRLVLLLTVTVGSLGRDLFLGRELSLVGGRGTPDLVVVREYGTVPAVLVAVVTTADVTAVNDISAGRLGLLVVREILVVVRWVELVAKEAGELFTSVTGWLIGVGESSTDIKCRLLFGLVRLCVGALTMTLDLGLP